MTTRPEGPLGRGVCGDERGAIIVMGIFMCACLVGILWYLAGIGDAIIFRERMQEGADATAFTAAVLHARGMNLLVMINLIMACILAVRVALRVSIIVLEVIGIALSWLGVGEGILAVAGVIQEAEKISQPIITAALEGLTAVEEIIPRVVPPAAIVGSVQVSLKYRPIVKEAIAGNPVTTTGGLPVEDGDPSVLCFHAAKAVVDIIFSFPGVSKFRGWFGDAFGDLVAAGGDYFCGLGGSSNPPDLSSLINDQTDSGCDKKKDDLQQKSDAAAQAYQDACDKYRASCSSQLQPNQTPATLKATEQADLSAKQGDAETKLAALKAYNGDQCRKEAKDKINQSLKNNSSSSSSGGKIAPRRVKADWMNGIKNAQMLAVAVGDTNFLNPAPKFVTIGQWQSGGTITVPDSAGFALAQAEYFYDCTGKWDSHSCNGKNKPGGLHRDDQELAMWNFHWRARLRRYNKPFEGSVPGLDKLSGALNALAVIQRISGIKPLNSKSYQNALLLKELGELVSLDPNALVIH
jgi:hypothetical protein